MWSLKDWSSWQNEPFGRRTGLGAMGRVRQRPRAGCHSKAFPKRRRFDKRGMWWQTWCACEVKRNKEESEVREMAEFKKKKKKKNFNLCDSISSGTLTRYFEGGCVRS